MASVHRFPSRNCWRISYRIHLGSFPKQKTKYVGKKSDGTWLLPQLERVEEATRTGNAKDRDIEDWIDHGWASQDEADAAFPGYTDTKRRLRNYSPDPTDYDVMLKSYEDYIVARGKYDPTGRNRINAMSVARQVVDWLTAEVSAISGLSIDDVESYRSELKGKGYAPWIRIEESICQATGEKYIPKDYEVRWLDVKPECLKPLRQRRETLKKKDEFGMFVLSRSGSN